MNGYLLSLGWDKNVAFWGTICGFGVINYLLLTFVVTGEDVDGGSNGGGGDKNLNRIPRGGGGGGGGDPRTEFVGNERRSRKNCLARAVISDARRTERSPIS